MRRTIEFLMIVDWKSFLGFVCWKPELRNQCTTMEYHSTYQSPRYGCTITKPMTDMFLARTSRKLISRKPKDFVALSISLSADRDVDWMLGLSMRALAVYTCCIVLWSCSISWDVERSGRPRTSIENECPGNTLDVVDVSTGTLWHWSCWQYIFLQSGRLPCSHCEKP